MVKIANMGMGGRLLEPIDAVNKYVSKETKCQQNNCLAVLYIN